MQTPEILTGNPLTASSRERRRISAIRVSGACSWAKENAESICQSANTREVIGREVAIAFLSSTLVCSGFASRILWRWEGKCCPANLPRLALLKFISMTSLKFQLRNLRRNTAKLSSQGVSANAPAPTPSFSHRQCIEVSTQVQVMDRNSELKSHYRCFQRTVQEFKVSHGVRRISMTE